MVHKYSKRVEYLDCDPTSLAKNSYYQEVMLAASMDLFLAEEINYFDKIERELGLFFATKKISIEFSGIVKPLDEIDIYVQIKSIKNFSIRFIHEIKKQDTLIARGFMEHACIDKDGELTELPGFIKETFSKYLITQ